MSLRDLNFGSVTNITLPAVLYVLKLIPVNNMRTVEEIMGMWTAIILSAVEIIKNK